MTRKTIALFKGALISACATTSSNRSGSAAAPTKIQQTPVEIVEGRTATWAFAKPEGWVARPGIQSEAMPVYLVGQEAPGMPRYDGRTWPIDLSILVQQRSRFGNAEKVANRYLEVAQTTRHRIGTPTLESAVLDDGTPAFRVRDQFSDPRTQRAYTRSILCAQSGDTVVVVSGSVGSAKASSGSFERECGVLEYINAHVDSLVLDPTKIDRAKIHKARQNLIVGLDDASLQTHEGNRIIVENEVLSPEDATQAAALFSSALEVCEGNAAAHNGLAWALAHSNGDLKEAERHALRAIELDARQVATTFDTLAEVYQRQGRTAEAIQAIEQAVALDPQPMFQERLELLKER